MNSPFKSIWINIVLSIFLVAALTACETVSYYGQAISGQITILNKRQLINQLLAEPLIPERLKDQLRLVLDIREFAQSELRLPVKGQYLSFADLERPYAVWNVYAAPEFSLKPKTWCHPVIGCTSYRGYFSRKNACHYADKLRKQGFDVFISGVAAYSTLGWFDDPVLNTFIYRNDIKLAALIFHELAHHLLYVANDTTFNESFASFVEQEGLRRWLIQKGNSDAFSTYETDYHRHRQFIRLVMKYRRQLELLYAKNLSPSNKRRGKAFIFDKLRSEYRQLKAQWQGYSGFDLWFSRPLNNAQMITVSIYYDLLPAFAAMLQDSGHDLELLYRKCQDLAKKSKEERHAYLNQY